MGLVLLFLAVSGGGRLPGAPSALAVPENAEARLGWKKLITAPLDEVLAERPRLLRQREEPAAVQFRVETQGEAAYLLFLNERGSGFPVDGCGSVILKRSRKDGSFQQMKVFFRDGTPAPAGTSTRPPEGGSLQADAGSFLRLFPSGSRCRMDVHLLGRRLYEGVILPVPFESLLLAPFRRIQELSAGVVDWPLLLHQGDREADARTLDVLAELRRRLPALRDRDDGAQDDSGRFVSIRDLALQEGRGGFNCSGFAKWVVDGFYRPLAGRCLDVASLKSRHPESRGNRWNARYESERDPYFGLDWSRNLAGALQQARTGLRLPGPEAVDVRRSEFFSYFEDVGYRIEDLEPVLFIEAAREPGNLYLGSINGELGSDPVLHQHFHLVVLFPFFMPGGGFRVQVMERNAETSLAALQARYPGRYVHLVRFPAGGEFSPPPVD